MTQKKPTLEYATPGPRRFKIGAPRTKVGKAITGTAVCALTLLAAWLVLRVIVNIIRPQTVPRTAAPAATRPMVQPATRSAAH